MSDGADPGTGGAASPAVDDGAGREACGAAAVDDGDLLGAYPYLLRSATATRPQTGSQTTSPPRLEPRPEPRRGQPSADLPYDFAAPVPGPGPGPGPGPAAGSAAAAPYDYARAEGSGDGARPDARPGPLSWAQARARAVRAVGAPLAPVLLPLADALGCVLSAPLEARTDLPAFDTSAMDGWAVSGPGPWRVGSGPTAARILAGQAGGAPLADGTAVRIATGAQLPPGATAVLRSEDGRVRGGPHGTELLHDHGATPLDQGRDIRPRGQECRTGEPLLPPGTTVSPAVLGLAAAAGCDLLAVHRRPDVELLVLGDELLDAGLPADGRTRDALGPLLPSWLRTYGAQVGPARRIGDDLNLLRDALRDSTADVVVTTGGTAAGPVDFLHRALAELGATLLVDGVRVRPGHPMLLAVLPAAAGNRPRHVVGLPGNPLAAVAGAATLAEPLLRALAGSSRPVPYLVEAAVALPGHPGDARLVPVALPDRGVLPLAFDGPAMLRGLALAEGLAVVPPGGVPAGARVEILEVPTG